MLAVCICHSSCQHFLLRSLRQHFPVSSLLLLCVESGTLFFRYLGSSCSCWLCAFVTALVSIFCCALCASISLSHRCFFCALSQGWKHKPHYVIALALPRSTLAFRIDIAARVVRVVTSRDFGRRAFPRAGYNFGLCYDIFFPKNLNQGLIFFTLVFSF